jgi:hypothetical protein
MVLSWLSILLTCWLMPLVSGVATGVGGGEVVTPAGAVDGGAAALVR